MLPQIEYESRNVNVEKQKSFMDSTKKKRFDLISPRNGIFRKKQKQKLMGEEQTNYEKKSNQTCIGGHNLLLSYCPPSIDVWKKKATKNSWECKITE